MHYDLVVEESANSRIEKNSNLVSRNRPVAVIITSCNLVGVHLIKSLLEKNIQVLAIDDLTYADKSSVDEFSKNKDFHFLNLAFDQGRSLEQLINLNLSRFDYGFFITDSEVPDVILGRGVINFIEFAKDFKEKHSHKETGSSDKPRLVYSSTINLYARSPEGKNRIIKESESKFAKGIKHFNLNGRVVRLADVFGPGMILEDQNPLARLIAATVNDTLSDEKTSLVFTERSLFVDDAVRLLTKAVLAGSTSNKIYDGALLHPVKLSEIKQILSNPVWSEENPPELTKLPEWPTPNLLKAIKELSWKPQTPILKALRETIAYFKENPELVPKTQNEKSEYSKSWSFAGSGFLNREEGRENNEEGEMKRKEDQENEKRRTKNDKQDLDKELEAEIRKTGGSKAKRFFWVAILTAVLLYGLVWPFIYLGYQGFEIRNNLLSSRDALEKGEFDRAESEVVEAQKRIGEFENVLDNTGILEKIPLIQNGVEKASRIADLAKEGTDGVLYATRGSKSLFETTKIISGQSRDNPAPYYENAERDLQFASTKLSKISANLSDKNLKQGLPEFAADRIDDLKLRIVYYQVLVEQAKSAAALMPEITAVGTKKSYLVLLQNNLELRPGGGFIGSYAKLDFEDGRLKAIKVDDIYNLDGQLADVIAPPPDLKSDMNMERLYLRDSNYEPDFPSSARQASFFYKREAGEPVHGVIALDLKGSGYLLDAVGGVDLPEYGESVNGSNLFEKAISHAETNFFPGSQAKKNYLTSLQNQMFNKIFYLSKQNWPAIIQALGKSLKEKHLLVYLEDPSLFSYLASSNWSGVFPRGAEKKEGITSDFLGVIESNMGANKANYYLQRKMTVNASFTKEGAVRHQLKINYKNNSPSDIFPAGTYKNRLKIYTPLGSKLTKATLNDQDITAQFLPFSDYERSAFSALISVAPKEQKTLVFEYELGEPLNFADNEVLYRMEIFKQAGMLADPLDFILTYPINYKLAERPEDSSAGVQEVKIITDLQTDRVFEFKVVK